MVGDSRRRDVLCARRADVDAAQSRAREASAVYRQTLLQALQEEMNAATGVQNRGVKQAPFKVLVGATMPAALVEVAFISNPEEAGRLASPQGQARFAEAWPEVVRRRIRSQLFPV